MDSKFLVRQILRVLRFSFANLTKPQLKNLADVIVALFFNNAFTLREVASKMSSDSNVKHKLKKLQSFLDSLELDSYFFKSYIKTLFSLPNFCFRRRKYITLLLDSTTLLDDFYILSASISYKGRAIPVYVRMWAGVNEHYNLIERVDAFIKNLSKLLPKHNYEIVADRGYQGFNFKEIFSKSGWDYVVRISENYTVKEKDSPKFVQVSLFEDGLYENVTLGKTHPIENVNLVVNSATNEEGSKIRWYLMTTLKDKNRAIFDYSRRMWIEESFKDLKGILKWETYTKNKPEKSRLEKLLVISCLSYAIRLSLGSEIEVPKSEERKTSIFKRFQNIILSSYRLVHKLFAILTSSFSLNYRRSLPFFTINYG